MVSPVVTTTQPAGDPFSMAAKLADPFSYSASVGGFGGRGGRDFVRNFWGGDKFPGGFGITKIDVLDYWELRTRSAQLFRENLYARGLLRRLVTNEINVGLTLEAEPNDELLSDLTDEQAEEWGESVENRFEVWSSNPKLCDYEERRTFGELQQHARMEAMIEGDILVVLRMDKRTNLPKIQLIRGGRVTTPFGDVPRDKLARISNGVEVDDRGRHLGFWVADKFGKHDRIAAFGPRTKRRMAWLVYGTDNRSDQVRGTPILSLVLQSLNELDRYRDSEQRAATVNSILAMFIQKDVPGVGTLPISGGAVRNQIVQSTGTNGEIREFKQADQWPGMVIEELNVGEKPVSFDTKRPNANYPEFEAAIINAIAWANEVPPEVLTLAFSANYSASKAAINEFKAYLTKFRRGWGVTFCQPIYIEWLISETLAGRVTAQGFLEAWRNPMQFDVFGAWIRAEWGGPVKPSIELKKDVEAYGAAIDRGFTNHDRASKDLFGQRFTTVQKRLLKERRLIQKNNEALGITPQGEAAGEGQAAGGALDPNTGMSASQFDNVVELVSDELREA
ncbi:MAG: phage portal protein [Planctomycetota bacterium]